MTVSTLVPSQSRFQATIEELLANADVQLNGDRPWDVQVHNDTLYKRLLSEGSIAAGESYMDRWWDCDRLDELFARILRCKFDQHLKHWSIFNIITARFTNMQTIQRAFTVGRQHYDIGNDLYEKMLDPRMVYSCGYWKEAHTLEDAQVAKLDLIARKLNARPGMRVLDIGCGWGGLAQFLAQNYGINVVGVTISEQQAHLAKERCQGLPIDIRLQDYRSVEESFDRIVSVGMFEHVGVKNYRTYFECVRRCLKPNGIMVLQTIGSNESCYRSDPWIERYIFPNSMLPSPKQLTAALEGLMNIEDWHNFGTDYDKTLMQWHQNFERHWNELKETYGDRFYRMWRYYLLMCAGSFRARKNHLWQLVLSPDGLIGGYQSPR
jgi:cyclopropane-fatty-acyl-phospholipid synthase